ncbi:MAG: peptidylprolyl isomerase [Planctomycetes bacterium]|nr:peptidylprolyl isomerase [Planctomycetota bacterium]
MGNSQGTDYFNNQRTAFGRLEATGFLPGAPPPTAPDTTAPTVALASDTPAAISAGTIDYTATFSEDVSGFTAAGVDVANGSVTSFTQVDARTYRFSVTPAAQGTVTATVKAAAAFDAGGNVSTASNTVSRVFDTTAPTTPTFDLAPASDSGTVGDLRTDKTAVALTGTAEPGATVTLFRAVSGTAPGSQPVVATTTAGANGSFSFNVTLALGPNSYAIRATDAAGNSSSTFAQTFTLNSAPTATPISDQNLTVAGGAKTLDLLSFFSDAERVVRLSVTYPNGQSKFIDINLFPGAAPNTVANFLAYVNSANAAQNYNGTIFHRLVSGFVLQGGGYKFDDPNNTFTPTTKMAAVNNEPNVSNTRGTIAMAKTGGNPNSATSEFFFNLGDNSANLDVQNGGFTVFGQLMDSGQQTVDAISGLPTFSGTGAPGGGPTPISQGANTTSFPQNISASDLAVVTTAAELTAGQKMTFSVVGTSNSGVATASLNGSTLTINPIGPGTATITVRATDLDGSTTDVQIKVNVTA